MNEFFRQLKDRHLVRTAVVYLGGAWLLLEATGFFVENYALTRSVIDVVLLLLLLGFPAALIISWYHGERGRQSVAGTEASLLLTLAVLAAIGTYRITTAGEVGSPSSQASAPALTNPTTRAIAANDLGDRSVAVLPFTNATGLDSLAWIGSGVSDMLTTSLARTGDTRVVSPQRLFELLRAAGREETDEIPGDVAMEIASGSGARRMVRGSVLGTLDDLVFDVQLIDLADGTVIGGDRVRGNDVFAMSDSVAEWLSSTLDAQARPVVRTAGGLPQRPPVALSGDAERLKEYSLALRTAWREEGVDARYRVVDLLDEWEGRELEVRQALEEITRVNPGDSRALAGLIRVAVDLEDQAAVDSLIPTYMESESDSSRALMTVGRSYERLGRLEPARAIYRGMIERGIGGTDPLDRIARTYLLAGQPARARVELENIARNADPERRAHVRFLVADTYVWEGDFDRALTLYGEVERSGSTDTRAAALEGALAVRWLLDPNDGASRINRSVWTLLDLGRHQRALNVIEATERMYVREADRLAPVDVHALLYARARAFELMDAKEPAIAAYEELLADWGPVIERLPLLADAPDRLARLESSG